MSSTRLGSTLDIRRHLPFRFIGPRLIGALLWSGCALISNSEIKARQDADGDGHLSAQFDGDDCDDSDAGVSPEADERCNLIDDNCNDAVDEGVTTGKHPDLDGDGFGDRIALVQVCPDEEGYTDESTDCDDSDPLINPGQEELCDNLDNDCDPSNDERPTTWYEDGDGDGLGNSRQPEDTCDPESLDGYVSNSDDCDDTEAANTTVRSWYKDGDGDGYGDAGAIITSCIPIGGYVADNTDCDDALPEAYPGAEEICGNGVDEDCDGADLPCG